jgi:mRNA interferase YafQ
MRVLDFSGQFRRDYKRERKGRYRATLEADLKLVLDALLADRPLDAKYRDHPLVAKKDVRDCHIKPDLVLLYSKPDAGTLRLVRIGSHSELGI